jgi:hypothetical protein
MPRGPGAGREDNHTPRLGVLREQGTDGVWHALFYATGRRGVYSPPAWRHRAVLGEVYERKVWHGWE